MVKPFSFKGKESWVEVTHRSHGSLRIYPWSYEIEVTFTDGCDPFIGDIVTFLLNDKDVKLLIRKYQECGRKVPYEICIGGGGDYEDVFIHLVDNCGFCYRRKHLLHVSCFGKIAQIKRMYIGDFVEAVAEYYKNGRFDIRSKKTTCRYEKPYFADLDNVTTKVTKLI